MIAAALFLLAQAAAPAAAAPDAEVITVKAVKNKCQMSIANKILSDREFNARSAEWAAGKPLTVVVPPSATYKCMAKIVFRLNDRGVRIFHLVDAAPAPVVKGGSATEGEQAN